jgi:hypothetical protein
LGGEDKGIKLTQEISTRLKDFFAKDSYLTDLKTACGDRIDSTIAADIADEFTNGSGLVLPLVQILSRSNCPNYGAEWNDSRSLQ